jgi:hypothetical protein
MWALWDLIGIRAPYGLTKYSAGEAGRTVKNHD